jgi:hypothetical protein
MGRLLRYAFVLALAGGVGCYVVLGPFSLEDLDPSTADRNAAAVPNGPTSPTSPASIDEELDYTVAKQLASLAGWRTFLSAHPSGAYAQSARAEVARLLGAPTTTADAAPGENSLADKPSGPLASLRSYAQLAMAKVEQLLNSDEAPSSGNLSAPEQTPAGGASQLAPPAPSAAEGALPSASAPSHVANPADNAEPSSTLPARNDSAAGTQLAALAPDETCRRDEARLAQLRSAPSPGEAARFANELGCERLRSQVLDLMQNLTPAPAQESAALIPPGVQVESVGAHPASPLASVDVASPESSETCKRDEERLARLGSNPSGDEALRFVKELGCERLLPELQRLLHGPEFDASAPANPSSSSSNLLSPVCASEREALDRLRAEPSAGAAGLFSRDLKCEGLRPQVRLLMESLGPPDLVGSAASMDEPKAPEARPSTQLAAGANAASCQRETAELNHVRETPDLGDAKRFANALTCNALKPQVARLLESFGQ